MEGRPGKGAPNPHTVYFCILGMGVNRALGVGRSSIMLGRIVRGLRALLFRLRVAPDALLSSR
eukprot:4301692-Prymnesium_polylepis.1